MCGVVKFEPSVLKCACEFLYTIHLFFMWNIFLNSVLKRKKQAWALVIHYYYTYLYSGIYVYVHKDSVVYTYIICTVIYIFSYVGIHMYLPFSTKLLSIFQVLFNDIFYQICNVAKFFCHFFINKIMRQLLCT